MKIKIFLFLSFFVAVQYSFANEQSTEHVLWDKKPIRVLLPENQERIIHFPADIRYWLPDSVQNSVTAMAANGVLYIKATKRFEKTRIRVQEFDSPQVYLLDLVGVEEASVSEEIIILREDSIENKSKTESVPATQGDWYARLIRVAAQNMYAPERLIESDAGIHRIKLKKHDPVRLIKRGQVEAIPRGAWQGGGYYVTALRLRNLSHQTEVIDPRTDIRGDWLVATLQHSFIDAAGSDKDRTCIYLISNRRFEESL